jgi:hypothetical protein
VLQQYKYKKWYCGKIIGLQPYKRGTLEKTNDYCNIYQPHFFLKKGVCTKASKKMASGIAYTNDIDSNCEIDATTIVKNDLSAIDDAACGTIYCCVCEEKEATILCPECLCTPYCSEKCAAVHKDVHERQCPIVFRYALYLYTGVEMGDDIDVPNNNTCSLENQTGCAVGSTMDKGKEKEKSKYPKDLPPLVHCERRTSQSGGTTPMNNNAAMGAEGVAKRVLPKSLIVGSTAIVRRENKQHKKNVIDKAKKFESGVQRKRTIEQSLYDATKKGDMVERPPIEALEPSSPICFFSKRGPLYNQTTFVGYDIQYGLWMERHFHFVVNAMCILDHLQAENYSVRGNHPFSSAVCTKDGLVFTDKGIIDNKMIHYWWEGGSLVCIGKRYGVALEKNGDRIIFFYGKKNMLIQRKMAGVKFVHCLAAGDNRFITFCIDKDGVPSLDMIVIRQDDLVSFLPLKKYEEKNNQPSLKDQFGVLALTATYIILLQKGTIIAKDLNSGKEEDVCKMPMVRTIAFSNMGLALRENEDGTVSVRSVITPLHDTAESSRIFLPLQQFINGESDRDTISIPRMYAPNIKDLSIVSLSPHVCAISTTTKGIFMLTLIHRNPTTGLARTCHVTGIPVDATRHRVIQATSDGDAVAIVFELPVDSALRQVDFPIDLRAQCLLQEPRPISVHCIAFVYDMVRPTTTTQLEGQSSTSATSEVAIHAMRYYSIETPNFVPTVQYPSSMSVYYRETAPIIVSSTSTSHL